MFMFLYLYKNIYERENMIDALNVKAGMPVKFQTVGGGAFRV